MPDGRFTDDDHREQILEVFSSFECLTLKSGYQSRRHS